MLVAVCRALGLQLVDLVGAAHAELALAEGRVVVDLTARRRPATGGATAATVADVPPATRRRPATARSCSSPDASARRGSPLRVVTTRSASP